MPSLSRRPSAHQGDPVRVAIFGSREAPQGMIEECQRLTRDVAAKYPMALVVSGGAKGIDMAAEAVANECGLSICSYRPYKLTEESYGIERWMYGKHPAPGVVKMIDLPTFRTYGDAASFRDMLISESAEVGIAFQFKGSRGTALTIEFFRRWEKKDCHVYTEEVHYG